MTDQRILTPAEAVAERIETRRATLPARLPEASPVASSDTVDAVCDGWGLVPVLASDGNGYEPAACLGCALCSDVRPPVPGRALARMPVIEDEVW